MKPHDTFLELAAIAIDFPLTSADRGRLEQHLAGCAACGRTAHELRGDALALSHLPPVTLPERRGAEILAAALHPPVVRNPVRLAVVAALLGLLLLGSLAVGSELLRRMDDDDLGVVLPVPSQAASPDASPAVGSASDTLVVTRGEGDARAVEILTPSGETTRLAEGWDPAWVSSDTIIYTCLSPWVQPGEDPGQPGICAVNLRAPATPQTLIAEAYDPVPAPDGRSIAVHRGMIDVGETWIMSADGSNPRLLRSGWFPQWSPDGAWLAGQPETPGNAEVAIVGADGQGFRVLAPGYDPAWSPTGRHIAYAVVEGNVASLRTVDVSSGAVEILHTAPAGEEVSAPVYLAEGRIAFVQDGNVWVLDSSGPRAIMSGHAIEGSPAGDPLAVSPDGSRIAFTHGAGTEAIVEIREINGGNELYPANGSGPVTQPAWSPAGSSTPSPDGTPAVLDAEPLGTTWQGAQMQVVVGRPVGRIEAVTAGGLGFVAVGRGCLDDACELVVWTSTDGKAWQRVPTSDALDTRMLIPTSGPEIGMFDVAAGGPGVVAVGNAARPEMEATAWFSPDGVSWERFTLGDADLMRIHAVTWDGRQFVAVGEDRSEWDGTLKGMAKATARAAVWTSSDGRTWSRVPHSAALDAGEFKDTMEDPSTGGMADVVAGPGGLVAVGSVCESTPSTAPPACEPAAWASTDGTSWDRVAGIPSLTGSLKAIATSGSGYVAVGATQTCDASVSTDPWGCPALVLTSPDGQVWTQQPFEQPGDLRTLTVLGGRYFATAPDGPQTLWTSDDGSAWVPADVQGGPATSGEGWHFAATQDTAVWIGTDPDTNNPVAWVSSGK
jgi:hypothetical protein